MSSILERPRARNKSTADAVGPRSLPQVNLLPPEVRAARGLAATKRWLVIGLLAVIAGCVAVWGLALVSTSRAAADLADAEAETTRLNAEVAQYSEVPKVLGALSAAENARVFGMSTDVQWRSYVDAIAAVLPADISIDTYTIAVSSPTTPPATTPANPLEVPSVGRIDFSAKSATVPNTAAWLDALDSIPGLADATASSVTVTAGEDSAYYSVSLSVLVTDAAYSHRFDETKGQG